MSTVALWASALVVGTVLVVCFDYFILAAKNRTVVTPNAIQILFVLVNLLAAGFLFISNYLEPQTNFHIELEACESINKVLLYSVWLFITASSLLMFILKTKEIFRFIKQNIYPPTHANIVYLLLFFNLFALYILYHTLAEPLCKFW